MTWYGWLIIGVILGIAAASALVAAVGRESEERGGTLTFDSPDARAVFKHWREASTDAGGMRTTQPLEEHPFPVILDPRVPVGTFRVVSDADPRCDPAKGTHYHGAGDYCECGAQPNVRGAIAWGERR